MRQRDVRAWLFDIVDAAQYILEIAEGKELLDLINDRALRQLVERNLEIIGEAVASLIRTDPTFGLRITQARDIVGLRNRLTHAYFTLDLPTVWDIVQHDVPGLVQEAAEMLGELGPSEEEQ